MKKMVGKRGRARALRSVVAVALSGLLVLTGCQTQGVVNDDYVPLAATSDAPEVFNNAEEEVEYTYTQTLDDGTVIASDGIDVSNMDFSISTTEVEAPEAAMLTASAMSVDTATGAVSDGDEMIGIMASAMGVTAAPMAADSILGGLTIKGGVVNTDFTHAANEVIIKTSTPLTLSGTFTGTVKVQAGVEAWIILNGVTITGNNTSSPINLMTSSKAHVILADGTTNTLNANQYGCAALHCGDGSYLWIDDAVVNHDFAANKHIDILYGKIGTDGNVTNMSSGVTTPVVVGDVFSKADTTGVQGKLIAKGGKGSAAIGAGPKEVAGNMTFDGGYIEAYSWGGHTNNYGNNSAAVGTGVTNAEGVNVSDSSGTGIGGGAGGGGATQTTFNGGIIYAFGSYHGAGIGAGWSSNSSITAYQNGAVAPTRNTNNAGNININGGYILSQGYAHGNAFGGACGTNMTGMTCRITGGTLRPFSHSSRADIGGSGGYVIIDGGSISLSGAQSAKFMSSNNKAYSDVARTQEVVPVEVDLSAQTGTVDFNITEWTLLIDGKIWQYGAPSKFNAGKLTLWLPPSAKTQKVEVQLNYYDTNRGSEVLVEPLYREAGSTSSNVKRNVYFDMPYEGVFGDATIADETLPTITNFPNELLVGGVIPTTVKALEKEYDGLPFKTATITDLTITESISKDTRKLTNNDLVTYSYRLLNGNTFTDELTSSQMPSDTGLMAFAMNSTEYAQGEWGKSYIGHRSTGYVRIKPVPAILTLEGAEWGYLDLDTGDWTKVTDADAENAGNRIKVTMNLRSAIGTAVTCKTPTGSVQLYIGGKKFGEPIVIGPDAETEIPEASKWSTYTVTEGPTDESANTPAAIASAENRWTAHITYYMDPHQADSLLNPKKLIKLSHTGVASPMSDVLSGLMSLTTDGKAYAAYDDVDESTLAENEYKLSGEYLPDKNYVEGVEANPQNADATATVIIPVDTRTTVSDDQGTTYEFTPVDPTTPGGDTPAGSGGTAAPVTGGNTFKSSVTKSYSDFHKKDAEGNETIEKDYFVLQVDSTSAMPMEWHSSNPAVADVVRDADGNVVYDENGNPKVQVFSCGPVTLTMHQDGNAVYNEQTRIIDMNVIPDESLKPDTEARVLWRNLTHPGMPAAPGDEIEYTIVGSNLTDGSSWQDVSLGDVVAPGLTIDPETVSVLRDFTTPEDRSSLTAEDLDEFTFEPVADVDVTDNEDGTSAVSVNVSSIHGGQSSAVRFTVKVGSDLDVTRAAMTGENPPTIPNTPTAEGSYGVKETADLVPGEDAGEPIEVDDTVIIGIDPNDPVRAAVLPRDPVLTGDEADMAVSKTAENVTRDTGITLPGDTVSYAITISNTSTDACLHWPVIRDTVPKGLEPVAGTFELTLVDGNKKTVGDEVFVTATHTVALYVDDLYAGESTTLTFQCKVSDNASQVENMASVMGTNPSDKWKGENPDEIDPMDEPVVPDPEKAKEILGGEILPPEDPENPEVVIGDVTPDSPFTTAKKADPTDPTKASEPEENEPIQKGDVIKKFGDKTDPTDPQDIADELDRIIKQKLTEDPEATEVDIPVRIERPNPEDPENPEIIDAIVTVPITPDMLPAPPELPTPPAAGDPWTPDSTIPTEEYPWDDFDWEEYTEREGIPQAQTEKPATPGTLLPAKDPKMTEDADGKAEIEAVKTAENLSNTDGNTYVGDRVRYTITVSNSGEGTTWFDAVVRDDLPAGVEIDMATAALTTANGESVSVDAKAYDPMTRRLAVNVGDVPGGKVAVLTFECTVVAEAADGSADIGNIAKAYGKLPSEMKPEDLDPANRPTPGSPFDPGDDWGKFEDEHPGLTTPEKVYPTDNTRVEGVKPADQSPTPRITPEPSNDPNPQPGPTPSDEPKTTPPTGLFTPDPEPYDEGDGEEPPVSEAQSANPPSAAPSGNLGTQISDSTQKYLKLAQTGDPAVLSMIVLLVVVAAGGLTVAGLNRRQRRHEEDILS